MKSMRAMDGRQLPLAEDRQLVTVHAMLDDGTTFRVSRHVSENDAVHNPLGILIGFLTDMKNTLSLRKGIEYIYCRFHESKHPQPWQYMSGVEIRNGMADPEVD